MLVAIIGDPKALVSYRVCIPPLTCVTSLIYVVFSDYQAPCARNSRNQNALSAGRSRGDGSPVRRVE